MPTPIQNFQANRSSRFSKSKCSRISKSKCMECSHTAEVLLTNLNCLGRNCPNPYVKHMDDCAGETDCRHPRLVRDPGLFVGRLPKFQVICGACAKVKGWGKDYTIFQAKR